MKVEPLAVDGAFLLAAPRAEDDRGWFVRAHDDEALAAAGLVRRFPQHSVSHTNRAGSVRGLHLQRAPHEETKIVRCVRGRSFDVVVDLRPSSPTFLRWDAVELDPDEAKAVYIPTGCAHGMQALADVTDLLYQISTPFAPDAAVGVRWDDPTIGVDWPLPLEVLSRRDADLPFLADGDHARLPWEDLP